ncbi:MAG TPA: TolC family protein, partial [Candidatus Methylomirabilis sp.]|nr:TolC family protein [Candidatus Methylomirabilis sp.]
IDIAVSQTEKEIGDLAVQIEEAAFLPKFTGELSHTRSVAPSTSTLTGNLAVDQRILKFNVGMTELLPVGANLSLSFENQRQELSSAFTRLTPEYTTSLTFSAAVPLLKNRGREATEAPLEIARAGAAAKTEEWKARVMDVVAAARAAFLSFYSAGREVEVRRTAVELAERLLAHTRARIEAGAAASMELLPAEAAAAARREELLRAEAAERTAEDDLKNVLGVRTTEGWEERFVPVPPAEEILPPTADDTFEEAVRKRPEFISQAVRKNQADLQERVARSRNRPSLDLTASGGLSGLAGTPNPNPLLGPVSNSFEGNYADSLDQLFSTRYYNWFVGLSTEIPWGLEREKAEWARARAAAREQRLLSEGIESKIRMEIRKGRRDVETSIGLIEASRVSVAAAERKLEAEEKKLGLGRSTVYQVLQFQQDLSDARLSEIRALVNAHRAQTALRRAVGTILEKEGIISP